MCKKLIGQTQAMLKKIQGAGAFYIVFGNFLIKFVSFFGSALLARSLTKPEMGILSYYENLTGYFLILAGCGLHNGVLRYMVLEESPAKKREYFSFALRWGTVWNILLCVAGSCFCLLYAHPAAFENNSYIMLVILLCLPFLYVVNLSLAALRASFDYKGFAILSFSTGVILILLRIVGAMVAGLNGTVSGRLAAEILCGCACAVFVKKKLFSGTPCGELSPASKRGMLAYSFQLMLTDGLWAVFMLNDTFLLGRLCGSEILVADYKIAYVIPANLSILVSAVGTFVGPYFTKHENDRHWVQRNFLIMFGMTAGIMGCAAFVCFLLARPLIVLLYTDKYLSAVPTMQLLLVASFVNNGIRAPIANVLSSMGKQKVNLFAAVIGIVIQILLDIIFIRRLGITGAALTSTVAYSVMAFMLLAYLWRIYYKS